MKDQAYLFGPFIGSLDWEFYRFASYAIYFKKNNPDIKIIVLTRPDRFDLYGKYADLFVKLNIENDDINLQNSFKSEAVSISKYYKLVRLFKKKFENKYNIIKHFYPDIRHYHYKIKWQFPRDLMDYEFKPRQSNKVWFDKIYDSTSTVFVDFSWIEDNYLKNKLFNYLDKNNIRFINYEDIINIIPHENLYGVLIMLLKKMKLIIGNIKNSNITKLSLLLKTPIITIDEELSEDSISLLNPLKTKVRFYKSGDMN